MFTTRISTYLISLLLLLGASVPVAAVPITINQSKASAGNVTPGDAPGFPVTLSQRGSYRLDSNLIVGSANTTAIRVTADNVTIDLDGFVIKGPATCAGSGSSITCGPSGTGRGIDAAFPRSGIVVTNGQVRGMGGIGVFLGTDSRVERVIAINNERGIVANGIVTGNVASSNFAAGINATGTVSGNTAEFNGGVGINVGNAGAVLDNVVNSNASFGLQLGSTTGYARNVLTFNNGSNGGSISNPQVENGINLGQNVCDSAVCP